MANKILNTRILLCSDTSENLAASDKVFLKGEVVIEYTPEGDTKMKIGNGVNVFADLPYFAAGGSSAAVYTYEGDTTDVEAAVEALDITPAEGNMLVIKSATSNDAMGYTYISGAWCSFSGNTLADNVIFTEDLVAAGNYEAVGNVTKAKAGTATLSWNGKSLTAVMKEIFSKELQPTKVDPTVSITLTQATDNGYEVGTTVTPTWTAALDTGSYSYDASTGVALSSWAIEDTDGHTDTTATGTFPAFVVTDATNYSIKATATYSDGNVAKTNLGNDSDPEVKIVGGTTDKTSKSIKGYRKLFYGVLNSVGALDSAAIRALTGSTAKAKAGKYTVSVGGNASAKRIIMAVPTSYGLSVKNVMKTDGLAMDITSTYTKIGTVNVDGVNNVGNTVSYDIWCYQPASIDAAEVHEITVG